MKKGLFILLATMMSLCFFSCSDDDAELGITREALQGSWKVVEMKANGESLNTQNQDVSLNFNNGKFLLALDIRIGFEQMAMIVKGESYKINGNNVIVDITSVEGNLAEDMQGHDELVLVYSAFSKDAAECRMTGKGVKDKISFVMVKDHQYDK